jgi:hypothetical protein
MTMNRAVAFTAAFLAASLALRAAAEVQNRPVSGFTGVSLSIPGKMELVQGDTESLSIEGAAEDLAKVETVVEDHVLHIRMQKEYRSNWSWNPKFRMTLHARTIESIRISGSGDIDAKSLKGNAVKLAISGSGDIRIPSFEVDSAAISISGSGDIQLGGRAGSVNSSISGSGDLKAAKLEARNVSVSIAGAGDVSVWAREALQVRIAGSGDVRYYGDPSVEKRIAGSGSVRRLGPSPG